MADLPIQRNIFALSLCPDGRWEYYIGAIGQRRTVTFLHHQELSLDSLWYPVSHFERIVAHKDVDQFGLGFRYSVLVSYTKFPGATAVAPWLHRDDL